jgi:ATP-dependent HslUV protease ATP-binding subunit HslU
MTPRQIVAELDKYIVGQHAAKKAVAVAIRHRWRRQQLAAELRTDVTPKNIILIGPTGVGKTEIARRLAQLVGAPFIKVEATKFTEVGYVGRDVESIIRALTEAGIGLVKQEMRVQVQAKAKDRVTERLLDMLVPAPKNSPWEPEQEKEEQEKRQRTRDKFRAKLEAGELEDRVVELTVEQKAVPVQIFSNMGMENMDVDLQNMFDKIMPRSGQPRQLPIKEARKILMEQETEALMMIKRRARDAGLSPAICSERRSSPAVPGRESQRDGRTTTSRAWYCIWKPTIQIGSAARQSFRMWQKPSKFQKSTFTTY